MHTPLLRRTSALAAAGILAAALPFTPTAEADTLPSALDACISEALTAEGKQTLDQLTVLTCPETQATRGKEITSLSALSGALQLETITLDGPLGITDLTTLPPLPSLTILEITHASLTSLEGIQVQTSLQSLDFSYNSLTDVRLLTNLPEELTQSIYSLELVGNPITNEGVEPGVFHHWLTRISNTYISDQTGLGRNTSGIEITTPVTISFDPIQGETYTVDNIAYKGFLGLSTSSYTSVPGDTLPHFSITHDREAEILSWMCDAGCDQIRPGLPYKVAEIKRKIGRMGGFDYVQVAQVNFTFETGDRAKLETALTEAKAQQARFTTDALDAAIKEGTQLKGSFGTIKEMQDTVAHLTAETLAAHELEPEPAPEPTPDTSSDFSSVGPFLALSTVVLLILHWLGLISL